MSAKSKAVLTTENVTIMTSQTSPDTITPTTLGVMIQDIIDSMYNTVDGITISGAPIATYIQSLITQIVATANTVNPYLFLANKTLDQPIAAASGNYKIVYEDDTTAPNYDVSNLFYFDQYVSNQVLSKTFVLENVVVKAASVGASDSFRIRILKNGVEVCTSATLLLGTGPIDIYGSQITGANGYRMPTLISPIITMAIGDIITSELVYVYSSATTLKITKAKFSNA